MARRRIRLLFRATGPFEELHGDVAIAAVVAGSFQCCSANGRALLCPGSFVLGDAGRRLECGHDDGTGDRCIAFHFTPAFFEEIAGAVTGLHRFRFPAVMIPPAKDWHHRSWKR
jgi:hypothetical protein